MANNKAVLAVAVSLGIAAGAGGERLASPPHDVAAKVVALRLLEDGHLAASFHVQVGAAVVGREIVWDAKGASSALNGVPLTDAAASSLGLAAAAFAKEAALDSPKLADALSRK